MKPVRLFYVDDSGAERSGIATFSWLELAADHWGSGLRDVLAWRKDLDQRHGIAKQYELHATNFANGRGNPSSRGEGWNRRKLHRSQVVEESLCRLATWEWVGVGTIFSRSGLRRTEYSRERARVYRELVSMLDVRLRRAGELGYILMDGDGTDATYASAHRSLALDGRALMEDPGFLNSHHSQWIQLADMVAYASYQQIVRLPEKEFAWNWRELLNGIDTGLFEV
ncbi:DUF3800 domain-containing protein [Herbiconiux moechotypicola]|uniref:DUF3800 domain-containing protein n=1 Tax=Herbiconiux moechotypicola TaxID=637393 RepID=UPI00217EF66F|nr:DUF3800 domain-containing protein [Herbiconiux moechotypicola]MCS5731213.1 DUF3800 domain-containing protein [Herbiconiux moechotypicola]